MYLQYLRHFATLSHYSFSGKFFSWWTAATNGLDPTKITLLATTMLLEKKIDLEEEKIFQFHRLLKIKTKMAFTFSRDVGALQHVMLHLIVHLSVQVVCTTIVEV